MGHASVSDLVTAEQVETLEGKLLQMNQASVSDLVTPRQVEVLEGKLL